VMRFTLVVLYCRLPHFGPLIFKERFRNGTVGAFVVLHGQGRRGAVSRLFFREDTRMALWGFPVTVSPNLP